VISDMTDVMTPAAPALAADMPPAPTASLTQTQTLPRTQPQNRRGPGTRRQQETNRLLEEAALAPSSEQRSALLDRAIELNLDVARDIARRYQQRGVPDDDLVQVANLALVKAARGFDPTRGADFLSYAVPTIRGEIRRYFRDYGWTIRPPRSIQEAQTRITAAQGELFHELGRSPRPSEIAARIDMDLETVQEALAANGCFTPDSLDATPADGVDPAERLGEDEPGYAAAEARVMLQAVLGDLTPRERRILEMRFVEGRTQAEIGAEIGVTQMQVSRLLSGLLERLRERLRDQSHAA
jgi:RNA polymerase sigma-B factor